MNGDWDGLFRCEDHPAGFHVSMPEAEACIQGDEFAAGLVLQERRDTVKRLRKSLNTFEFETDRIDADLALAMFDAFLQLHENA